MCLSPNSSKLCACVDLTTPRAEPVLLTALSGFPFRQPAHHRARPFAGAAADLRMSSSVVLFRMVISHLAQSPEHAIGSICCYAVHSQAGEAVMTDLSNWTPRQRPDASARGPLCPAGAAVGRPRMATGSSRRRPAAMPTSASAGCARPRPESRAAFQPWLEKVEASEDPLFFTVIDKASRQDRRPPDADAHRPGQWRHRDRPHPTGGR